MNNKQTSYPVATGEMDYQRLSILNKLYNPGAQDFLKLSGIKPNMQVLEIGCGIGQMACWLAQQVLPNGRVTAVDFSAEQLTLARQYAQQQKVINVDFVELDIRNLKQIQQKFDLVYGRWIIEFFADPFPILQDLFNLLNPNGILSYESLNFEENGHFSFPRTEAVDRWFANGIGMAKVNHFELNLNLKLLPALKQLGCKDIIMKINQPILLTPEEKSVLRLGLISLEETLIKHNVITQPQFNQLKQDLITLEHSDTIIGFFRNFLISGIKPKINS